MLKSLLDLFLETSCPLCQRSTPVQICPDCQRRIQSHQFAEPHHYWQPPLPIFAWGSYGGALKRAIATLKYHNHPELAQPLGQWLAQAWLSSPVHHSRLVVVPIPMHPDKQKKRGFNQAELLARAFCDSAGLPLQVQGLERIRATEAQFALSVEVREQNLKDAFQLGVGFRIHPPTMPVLLIDDIYTTGATARSAAQAFEHQGITVYGLAAIASPAHNPHPSAVQKSILKKEDG